MEAHGSRDIPRVRDVWQQQACAQAAVDALPGCLCSFDSCDHVAARQPNMAGAWIPGSHHADLYRGRLERSGGVRGGDRPTAAAPLARLRLEYEGSRWPPLERVTQRLVS